MFMVVWFFVMVFVLMIMRKNGIVLMVMFMVVHMIMWMFSLAHDVPPFGSDR